MSVHSKFDLFLCHAPLAVGLRVWPTAFFILKDAIPKDSFFENADPKIRFSENAFP